jgi:hypothetical protein
VTGAGSSAANRLSRNSFISAHARGTGDSAEWYMHRSGAKNACY